ncbi:polysaccharide deacetylase family protein [Polymorphospora lycopeni]|uniref:Polysaccharide deacetylase family protein n=1 Tax=Polymorphospora lycopeni TaxID=3140240 RepID=A0ABV5CV48_9ACTN
MSRAPTVCVTVDFDGHALWLQWDSALSPTRMSRADFGGEVGMPRLLDLFATEEVLATIYVPGHTVETFPEVCRRAVAEGHEIGHHGYLHKDHTRLSEAQERAEFERAFAAYDKVLGLRPTGFRAPGGDLSTDTLRLAAEFGIGHDASGMGHDVLPYYARRGDRWTPDGPLRRGEPLDVVTLPVLSSMIDVPQMDFLIQPPISGLHGYDKILRMWLDELDWMCQTLPDGVLTLILHPSSAPRGARLRVVRDFLRHARSRGVQFRRHREVAARFRAENPFSPAAPC